MPITISNTKDVADQFDMTFSPQPNRHLGSLQVQLIHPVWADFAREKYPVIAFSDDG